MSKTFYAIYDVTNKLFKGRGNMRGVRWTAFPTQTYDSEGRATSALKAHLKTWKGRNSDKYVIVIPVTVTWQDPQEILENLYK